MSQRGTSRNKKKQLSPKYCEICGYTLVVQQHRIKPGRDGGEYVLGNVISLCPNHHFEADRGIIKPRLLVWIVSQRINGKENPYIEPRSGTEPPQESESCSTKEPFKSGNDHSRDVWNGLLPVVAVGLSPYQRWGQRGDLKDHP